MEDGKHFEYNKGVYNAYEYDKVNKDGVADISKRREMEKSYVTGGIVDTNNLEWIDKNRYSHEVILSKEQVEDFNKLIDIIKDLKLPKLNLGDIKINDACSKCPNHPSNGGSGVCNCTLPYVNNPITNI